jgi:hypothetical protein
MSVRPFEVQKCIARLEVFTEMKIEGEVFWVVTPHTAVYDTNVSEDHAASIFSVKIEASQHTDDCEFKEINCRVFRLWM